MLVGIFDTKKANHVLVNEYLSGQGIMPHFDGPLFYPTITTISCGSHTILEFYESITENQDLSETTETEVNNSNSNAPNSTSHNLRKLYCKLLIERRSLLILKDDMYHKYLHAIDELTEDIIDESILNLNQCCDNYTVGEKVSREKRISLTIRHVPKTTKMKLKLGN